MSLLFNMLSRFVTAFLPRSKCLLISWLQFLSAVILEAKKIKSVTVSIVSPSICHEVMGSDAMILVFWMLSFKLAFSLFFTFIICYTFLPPPSHNFTRFKYNWLLLQSILERQVLVRRKGCFIQEAGNLRRRWTHLQESVPKIGHITYNQPAVSKTYIIVFYL